jgi:DMSO/TMAO reductase YedYZ molybdopterin-dependent catalytic subunit
MNGGAKHLSEGRPYSRREFLRVAGIAGATIGVGAGLGGLLTACGSERSVATTEGPVTSTLTTTAATTTTLATGDLEPVVPPTLPAEIPTDVDPATGLHVTGTPQVIDLASYRLVVTGKVARELSLAYDDLRRLPKVTTTATTVCPGVFQDTTTRSGVPLHIILEMAGVESGAARIVLTAAGGYGPSVSLDDALQPQNFLAYELLGQTLPVLQGFPLRAVFPDRNGSDWVKWLLKIEVQ